MAFRVKRWQVAPVVSSEVIARFPQLHPILVQVLYNRGITNQDQADRFLKPDSLFGDPLQLLGMNTAIERLRNAIRAGEKIAVYGDFDVDGVSATALLVQTLQALGATVTPYIPHRVDEGYGLNREAMQQLKEQGTCIVVTVDSGIRSLEEVAFGKSIGLDMIVTDHHAPGDAQPDALAVINPKQKNCPYPFKDLSGSGVAFKMAQALLRAEADAPIGRKSVELTEEDLLDLVTLGTVADLVPLAGENRALVKRGLEKLRQTERPGIQALLRYAGVKAETINASTIGFTLGPRLNAAGRLQHALEAYHLLTTLYPAEADTLAQRLDRTNRDRQRLTLDLTAKAQNAVNLHAAGEHQGDPGHLLFVADPEFPEGIVGLIASRLSEEYYRPAVAVHQGPDESRGSARSISEFNIVTALDECRDLLVRYGGHAMAAGFTVKNENMPELETRLKKIAARVLAGNEIAPTVHVDAETRLSDMGWDAQKSLTLLEPFGYGNREPLFMSRNAHVRDSRVVGNGHLKLTLSDGQVVWDAIAFRQGDWAVKMPKQIDVVYELDASEWNGRARLQLNVKDLKPSES